MTILVTGADGYVGWPTALRIATNTDDRVVAIDNGSRREWVEEMGACSATPIASMPERLSASEEVHGSENLSYIEADLLDRSVVNRLLAVHEPSVIVHTAAQPSAPYSQIDGERANFTQHNNMQATRNLLFGLEEQGLTDTHFVETTTTGIYGSPEFPIPEGGGTMETGGERDDVPYPAMGGSWYHQCYDDETEILTKQRGWVPFAQLRSDDVVMAMDSRTGRPSWERPREIQSYAYSGQMVTVSSPTVDLCVTPNHRMLVGTNSSAAPMAAFDGREVVEARELGAGLNDPSLFTAFPEWEGDSAREFELSGVDQEHGTMVVRLGPREVAIEPFLELFGGWLVGGSVHRAGDTARIRLQAGADREYERAAQRLSIDPETVSIRPEADGDVIEIADPHLVAYFSQFEGHKRIPPRVRNLPRERLRTLFETVVGAESERASELDPFHSPDATLVDHLQEVALKLGYSATIEGNARIETASGEPTMGYQLNLGRSWRERPARSGQGFGTVPYDGQVYCCTVDGGIILVRRNGAPVWSGNSKSHDAANLRLAHSQFGLPISDVRTAIVYGTETEETRPDDRLKTRFDFDYYFGVVAHRFAAQAVAGYPLTVYGRGEQRKPFVSLEDTVDGLAKLALRGPQAHAEGHQVYNQVTRPIAIVEMAETIQSVGEEFGLDVEVTHVENPRDEDETHQMEIENDRYMELIGSQQQSFEAGVRDILETLTRYRGTIVSHTDRFLPASLAGEED